MAASKPQENINLEDLYKCHWFFGELSDEKAKEILIEAKKKEPNSEVKSILFLKTVVWRPSGQKHFTLVSGHIVCQGKKRYDPNYQPRFIFYENLWCTTIGSVEINPFVNSVMRTNPFSLEELALVKTATSKINVETLMLPKKPTRKSIMHFTLLRISESLLKTYCNQLTIWHAQTVRKSFGEKTVL